jgi:hypothetical protein
MEANTIFVQLASYRDPELVPTINDMIEHAVNPENLHIFVCWQHCVEAEEGDKGDVETTEDFLAAGWEAKEYKETDATGTDKKFDLIEFEKGGARISIMDVDYFDGQGACWARHQIQRHYEDEKYTFQLDSHHRFTEDWDVKVIEMLEGLRSEECPKPLLTAYIPSFDPENEPGARVQVPWRMDFDRFIPEGAVFFRPSSIDDWQERDKPMGSRFFSAHFVFVEGAFARDVMHDPEYFFHGEEISLAARAYTHGYDLFHPHRIIAWHEYTRKGRTKVWDDHTTPKKNESKVTLDWVERNDMCHRRNRILFGMDGEDPTSIDFGKFGFGTERTLRQYEEMAGISFQYRGVQQDVIDRLDPPHNFAYETEEEWKESFARSNDVHICLHKGEFAEIVDDFDFMYVGCHDENGDEIHRKDLVKDEIYNYLNSPNGFIDYRLIFLSARRPVTWTIWAHSVSKGWMDKIDKPLNY